MSKNRFDYLFLQVQELLSHLYPLAHLITFVQVQVQEQFSEFGLLSVQVLPDGAEAAHWSAVCGHLDLHEQAQSLVTEQSYPECCSLHFSSVNSQVDFDSHTPCLQSCPSGHSEFFVHCPVVFGMQMPLSHFCPFGQFFFPPHSG